jgi:phenylalanyl-tRNA synthetase alpha chain
MEQIKELLKNYRQEIEACRRSAELFNIKAEYLGKNGSLNKILKDVKNLDAEERRLVGRFANQAKEEALLLFDERLKQLEKADIEERLLKERQDISLKESVFALGLSGAGYHPLTLIRREVEDIFLSMGFDILDGPFIEDEYHNFSALNIPKSHPARDMQDTFWFPDLIHCLRTQTSPMQIRGMEQKKPPFKFLAPGKVFRNEDVDASHEMAFHQIEAMVVGEDIGVPHMVYFLRTTLSQVFKREVEVRLRTGFFPFVEPGFELDISCQICGGRGCGVCKHTGWIEFCGCGLIHPNVLKAGNIDSSRYSGFAFGMGWDRLAMMRYAIDDIRHFQGGDLRFIRQFGLY